MKLGLISDTHGLLRPEALAALRGCALIMHAGDIGGPEVLTALEALAPVVAVRGNNDNGAWAVDIPERRTVEVAGRRLLLLHDLSDLAATRAEGIDVVISGHSHRPRIERGDGVLFVNPGSAGPRRFKLPVTLALAQVTADGIDARIVNLL